ncbi:mucin-5AC-like isoform X2 [Dermacentor silvarum]|uniref:mucin-5AC-like isoform X2 n=1 Tax=Dermacentor silvarum TaxID=543639 RepID=UPI00210168EF|nr:mucin-5AC-like isoform X2 [Dermacentor silvarum]
MRGISILAALVVFATHAYGGPLNRLFCPPLCNPHPKPLRSCVHSCGFLRYGKYYDGSRCWYLGRSGKFLGVKGYCKQGLCLRVLTTGYEGSDAQTYCGVDQTKVVLHKATEGKGLHVKGAPHIERTTTENFSAIATTLSPQSNVKPTDLNGLPHTSPAHPGHSKVSNYVPTVPLSSNDTSTPIRDVTHPNTVTNGEESKISNKITNTSSHSEAVTAQSKSPESSRVKISTGTTTQPARDDSTYSTKTSTSHTQGVETNTIVPLPPHSMLHSSQPTYGGNFPGQNEVNSTRFVTTSASTLVSSMLGMSQGNNHIDVKITSGNRTTMPTENKGQFGDSSRQPTFLDNESIETHVPKTQAVFHPDVPAYVTITGDSGLSSPKVPTTGGAPTSNNETTAASTNTLHLGQAENTNGGVSTDSVRKQSSHGNVLSHFSAAQVGSIIQALRSAGEKWFHRTKAPVPESKAPPEANTTKYPENHGTPSEIPMSVEVTNAPLSVAANETHPPTGNDSTPAKITEGHYVVRNESLSAADVSVGKCAILVALLTVLVSY